MQVFLLNLKTYLDKSLDLMHDNLLVAKGDGRLWGGQRQRTQPRPKPTNKNKSTHLLIKERQVPKSLASNLAKQ